MQLISIVAIVVKGTEQKLDNDLWLEEAYSAIDEQRLPREILGVAPVTLQEHG